MITAIRSTRTVAAQRGTGQSRMAMITITAVTMLGLATGATLWATRIGFGQPADSTAVEIPVLTVNAQAAERRQGYEVQRTFVGRVEAARASDLGFELGGLIEAILVDEGEEVSAGQEIARLDTERLLARRAELIASRDQARARLRELVKGPRDEDIAEARADVQRYEAQLELARLTSGRTEKLLASRAVSEQEWDEARLSEAALAAELRAARQRLAEHLAGTRIERIDAQRAAVRQLESQIQTIDVELDKSHLKAPFAGIIATRFVDEGVVLDAGSPVVRLLEEHRHEARIGVAAEFIEQLKLGGDMSLALRGRTVSARVKAILPGRESHTRTVTVLLVIHDTAARVRSGDLVELELLEHVDESGFWLEASALTESFQGLWSSYVAEPAGEDIDAQSGNRRIVRRQLEVLHTEDGRVFVRGMLADGELVIIDGVHRLVPGQIVKLKT